MFEKSILMRIFFFDTNEKFQMVRQIYYVFGTIELHKQDYAIYQLNAPLSELKSEKGSITNVTKVHFT